MKNIFLVLAIFFVSVLTFAQNTQEAFQRQVRNTISEAELRPPMMHRNNASNSTSGNFWFSYIDALSIYMGTSLQYGGVVMLSDSLATVVYSNGQGRPQYYSLAQTFDFNSSSWNTFYEGYLDDNYQIVNVPDVSIANTYNIDSVSCTYVYSRGTNVPSSVVDTLIISIAAIDSISFTQIGYTSSGTFVPNFRQPKVPYNIQKNCIVGDTFPKYQLIKIPLRIQDTTGIYYYNRKIPISGFTNISEKKVLVSMAFKPGNSHTVSSVIGVNLNRFLGYYNKDPRSEFSSTSYGSTQLMNEPNVSLCAMEYSVKDTLSFWYGKYVSNSIWTGNLMRPGIGVHVTCNNCAGNPYLLAFTETLNFTEINNTRTFNVLTQDLYYPATITCSNSNFIITPTIINGTTPFTSVSVTFTGQYPTTGLLVITSGNLSDTVYLSATIVWPITITPVAPQYNSTSELRAPNGTSSHKYFRGSTIVLASDFSEEIPINTPLKTFGFMYYSGASSTVRGNLKVYMGNTTSTTYANGTDWSAISANMTLVYNGIYTIPENIINTYNDFALSTPFIYTGGSVYVAYEWISIGPIASSNAVYKCNNNLPAGVVMDSSSTSLPIILSSTSSYRPCMRFGYDNPYTNDVEVLQVYTMGKIPIPSGTPQVIKTILKNKGILPLYNIPTTLSITGANNFNNIKFIDTLLPGCQKLVTFDDFNPTNIGSNSVCVSVPSDQYNDNNNLSKIIETNLNTFSYSQGTNVYAGFGFPNTTGDIAVKFTSTSSQLINQVGVNFYKGGQPFQIGIWATDTTGLPGVILYNSQTYYSISESYTIPIYPPIQIPSGSFYVGVRQVGTTHFSFALQKEEPIRPNCFYIRTSPDINTQWTDLAPNYYYRFMIEPRFLLADDVSIKTLSSTYSNYRVAGQPIDIQATIINYGQNQQTTIPVMYTVNDGIPFGPINSTIPLNQGDTSIVLFNGVNSFIPDSSGLYTIKVFTKLPTDQSQDNDTLLLHYSIYPQPMTNYPYFQGFEDFEDITGWFKTGNVWKPGSVHSPIDEIETNSAFKADFYNSNLNVSGMLVTPLFNFSGISNPKLNFYVAYRTYTNEDDSLQIWVSKDFGQTYILGSPNLYKKSHSSIPSLKTLDSSSTAFYPNSMSDWRLETVDLSQFIGDSTILIAFKGISGYGNNCWIDQVRVYDYSLPIVSTSNPLNITTNSLIIGGSIISAGYGVIQKGVCFSTTPNPTILNDTIVMGSGNGSFSGQISGLIPNTTYYIRAFAINELGVAYGEQIITLTLPSHSSIIYGNTNVCEGEIGVVYSVNNIQNVVFNWSVPTGWLITSGQGTNSITVNIGSISGLISVIPTNSSGFGIEINKSISVSNLPVQPTIISGNINICLGSTNSYSIVNTSGLSYNWAIPNGWQIVSGQGTNSISVIAGSQSGNIIVSPINGCGAGVSRNIFVNVSQIPSQPSVITGMTEVCSGQNSLVYSVDNEQGVSYDWMLPTGWILGSGQGTNSITIYSGQTSGIITVFPSNSCGIGTSRTINIVTLNIPSQPSIISCPIEVCAESTGIIYTINNEVNTTYTWVVPSEWTITSGQGSNSITVNADTNSGDISVTPSNLCGIGSSRIIEVTASTLPAQPSVYMWPGQVCADHSGFSFTVVNELNVNYNWVLPSGWTITSGQGTNSIVVHTGVNSGIVSVTPSNSCGNGSSFSYNVTTVNPITQSLIITGPVQVCSNTSEIIYSVNNEQNVFYYWTVPTGWEITSGYNTNIISVTSGLYSGDISVIPANSCGNGVSSTKTITVQLLPTAAGIIAGNATVCQGENFVTYSVPDITNATSYVWTLPNGATGYSATNSISVDYGMAAISGNISVKGSNDCGEGDISTKAISVKNRSTKTITKTICNSYTAPDGQIYTTSGIKTAIISNVAGCDSIITINLTVNQSNSSTIDVTVCDSYTAPDGQIYTTSGIKTAIISNLAGCDSTIIINLTVNQSSLSTINATVCDSYTAPDGQIYTTSGTKTAIIPNATGCDSTITINLTVNQSSLSTINATVCDSYTAPDGQIYTTSGTKTAIIQNSTGCDSTITINLTVNQSSLSTINATACDSYTAPDGQIYTTSGTKTAIIPNSTGCDSTITINLIVNITPEPPTIILEEDRLVSSSVIGNQWYNQNGMIPNETNQELVLTENGTYFVKVIQNECPSDSSNLILVNNVNVQYFNKHFITISPNPFTNQLTIKNFSTENFQYYIYNGIGQILFKGMLDSEVFLNTSDLSNGLYIIKFVNSIGQIYYKVVKQ